MKNEFDYLNDVTVDFSEYEATELTELERAKMKKEVLKKAKHKARIGRYVSIAAVIAAVLIISQTAFAQNLVVNIIKSFSTGHNTFVQIEEQEIPDTVPVPEQLKGQIYDKDGNVLTEIPRDADTIYDKDGNAVVISADTHDGDSETEFSLERIKGADEVPESDENTVIYTSAEELQSVLNFALKTPSYLPEGYSLLYVMGFRTSENSDEISGDYAVAAYSNGENKFTVHERIINDETRFTTDSSDNLREIDINGNTAVADSQMVSWETDGISVTLLGGSALRGDELIKVAESIE